MKRHITIALAIALAALLGSQRSFAQTAVEALPRAGAPLPQISVPNLDTGPSAGEAPESQDQTTTAPESDPGDSDSDASDSNGGSQAQPDDSNSND